VSCQRVWHSLRSAHWLWRRVHDVAEPCLKTSEHLPSAVGSVAHLSQRVDSISQEISRFPSTALLPTVKCLPGLPGGVGTGGLVHFGFVPPEGVGSISFLAP